jgi:hypothetical protein
MSFWGQRNNFFRFLRPYTSAMMQNSVKISYTNFRLLKLTNAVLLPVARFWCIEVSSLSYWPRPLVADSFPVVNECIYRSMTEECLDHSRHAPLYLCQSRSIFINSGTAWVRVKGSCMNADNAGYRDFFWSFFKLPRLTFSIYRLRFFILLLGSISVALQIFRHFYYQKIIIRWIEIFCLFHGTK